MCSDGSFSNADCRGEYIFRRLPRRQGGGKNTNIYKGTVKKRKREGGRGKEKGTREGEKGRGKGKGKWKGKREGEEEK